MALLNTNIKSVAACTLKLFYVKRQNSSDSLKHTIIKLPKKIFIQSTTLRPDIKNLTSNKKNLKNHKNNLFQI